MYATMSKQVEDHREKQAISYIIVSFKTQGSTEFYNPKALSCGPSEAKALLMVINFVVPVGFEV